MGAGARLVTVVWQQQCCVAAAGTHGCLYTLAGVFFWLELSLISCRPTGTVMDLLQGKILGRILLRLTGGIPHSIFYLLCPLANSHFCVVVDFVCLLSQHFALQSLFIPTLLPARGVISRCHKPRSLLWLTLSDTIRKHFPVISSLITHLLSQSMASAAAWNRLPQLINVIKGFKGVTPLAEVLSGGDIGRDIARWRG